VSTFSTRPGRGIAFRASLLVAAVAVALVAVPAAGASVSAPVQAPTGASARATVQEPAGAIPCDLAHFQGIQPAQTTIVSVSVVSAPIVYCNVTGFVTTNPRGPNQVNFTLALPNVFNGRYILNAQGGSAGFLPPPPSDQLLAGYAIVGTDEGNQSGGLDYRFAVNRAQALDWDHLGVHVVTVATEKLTTAYYRQPKVYTYIAGCSGGGRSAAQEASLYPNDYDGALAGAPGINPDNILFFGQLSQYLLRHPDGWVSPSTLAVMENAVLKAWDASDGAIDGLIWEPWVIHFNFASLGILNHDQLTAVRMIQNGINDFGSVYPGYTISDPTGWSAFLFGATPPQTWPVPTPTPPNLAAAPAGFIVFDTWMRGLFGLNYNFVTQFNFSNPRDIVAFETKVNAVYPAARSNPAALLGFEKAGGKIVFWQGAADNAISVNDTIRYYTQLAVLDGGFSRAQDFARFFVAPGVFHCGGGPGPQDVPVQALTALTTWVESGHPASSLIAHSAPTAVTTRSFLLCPFPEVSVFAGGITNPGGLDVNDASNWSCGQSVPGPKG
jgi:Tannase and feruloyl esterase